MDQVKIGRFIAQRRKANNMTQMQLAEKLGITDRAVSKWETGKSLPDVAIMPELCGLLNITINDLFNGEVVVMEDYKEKSEKLLIEMAKQKEQADKNLLALEILIGVLSIIILLGFTFAASFFDMPDWARICLIIAGVVPCLVGCFFALKIDKTEFSLVTAASVTHSESAVIITATGGTFAVNKRLLWYQCSNFFESTNNFVSLTRCCGS